MTRVLVVAEYSPLAESMIVDLRRLGYEIDRVDTGSEALRMFPTADLVLLGLTLSDIDGVEVCRAMRAAGDVPIIAIANQDSELDRVLALEAGADDCVLCSCGFREIVARLEAVLRRTRRQSPPPEPVPQCPLSIDRKAREVRLRGRKIDVTAKEFDLLSALAATPEAVVSRKELMRRIWDNSWAESSRTIDTHVSSLRSKLGAGTWIVTVRGVGYRIGRG